MHAAVLLVHGAFGETSVWAGVVTALRRAGIEAVAAANPLSGLTSDAAYVASLARSFDGPVVLGGHDYGGAVISGVDVPNVVGLVYVAAFAPAAGESCVGLLSPGVLEALRPGVARGGKVELGLARERFGDVVGGDFALQRPALAGVFDEALGVPSWERVPSSFVVAARDGFVDARLQRRMAARADSTVVELDATHDVPRTHATEVAAEILRAVTRT